MSNGVIQFMGSPERGPIHTAQGLAEFRQHPVRGSLKALGGVLETAAIPGAFADGPAAEAADSLILTRAAAGRKGREYQKAMSMYRSTSRNVEFGRAAVKYGSSVPLGAGAAEGLYELKRAFGKQLRYFSKLYRRSAKYQ